MADSQQGQPDIIGSSTGLPLGDEKFLAELRQVAKQDVYNWQMPAEAGDGWSVTYDLYKKIRTANAGFSVEHQSADDFAASLGKLQALVAYAAHCATKVTSDQDVSDYRKIRFPDIMFNTLYVLDQTMAKFGKATFGAPARTADERQQRVTDFVRATAPFTSWLLKNQDVLSDLCPEMEDLPMNEYKKVIPAEYLDKVIFDPRNENDRPFSVPQFPVRKFNNELIVKITDRYARVVLVNLNARRLESKPVMDPA